METSNNEQIINGHAYADLGLSVMWATCNVGAAKPENYGDYYAWGETETKPTYDMDNCKTWKKEIGDISGTSRDVARMKWGATWRMPTEAEFDELWNNCDYEWTTLNGVKGGRFTSRKNGNSIFLPAAGGHKEENPCSDGYYWSATPAKKSCCSAFYLYFWDGIHCTSWLALFHGLTIRPVSNNPDCNHK